MSFRSCTYLPKRLQVGDIVIVKSHVANLAREYCSVTVVNLKLFLDSRYDQFLRTVSSFYIKNMVMFT